MDKKECTLCAFGRDLKNPTLCLPKPCTTYFERLDCFKTFQPNEPFKIKIFFTTTSLAITDVPHFAIAFEKSNMELALENSADLKNIKLKKIIFQIDQTPKTNRRILNSLEEVNTLCADTSSVNVIYKDGKAKVYLILSPECRTKLSELQSDQNKQTLLKKVLAELELPNGGKLNLLDIDPGVVQVELSKSQLDEYLEKTKPTSPTTNSLLSQLTDMKKLVSFDQKNLAEKASAIQEASSICMYLAAFGFMVGGFSLMQLAVMMSFLFRVVKKLILLNTNYPVHMKYMLMLMNPD